MNDYADILIPLALPGTFTYLVPQEMVGRLMVGCRVVVQFGAKRYYTGIVARLHNDPAGWYYGESYLRCDGYDTYIAA